MRKLGSTEMIQTFQYKLESSIEVIYLKFVGENDKKKMDFDVSLIIVIRSKKNK